MAAADAALERLALVDEADRLAREERLLSPPAVPEVGCCRRWLMTEIAVQLRGSPPAAWDLPRVVDDDVEQQPLSADEERALSTGKAPHGRRQGNRIIFVSDAVATLLVGAQTISSDGGSSPSAPISVRRTSQGSPATR